MIDNRLYQITVVATNYFVLNLLWLLGSFPAFILAFLLYPIAGAFSLWMILGFFPSTAALFAVVRDWQEGKEEGVFFPFLRYYRETLAPSLIINLFWLLFGFTIAGNFVAIDRMNSSLNVVFLSFNLFLLLVYGFASMFLFPLMVTYRLGWFETMKLAVVISFTRIFTTMLCLVIFLALVYLTSLLPILLFVTPGVAANIVYRLCSRAFQSFQRDTGTSDE